MPDETYETDYMDEPVCPHCGHRQRDAWEINLGPGIEGDGEMECGECWKEFLISRHCSVSYSTSKPQPKKSEAANANT